ncbi:MAK10-like protein [Tanacetum coccineum]
MTRLHLFQFFLCDQASNWLERILAGSISTWEDHTTRFLDQFFPPRRTAKLRIDTLMFQQNQVQIFYNHVNPATRRSIDQSTADKLRNKNAKESWALIEDLALYDNESWNDPRDFAKLVKEISLPQEVPTISDRRLIELENQVQRLMKAHIAPNPPVQVNKISSSCEICSGLHDIQYCMKNPEQAFVNYASSRNNKVGDSEMDDLTSEAHDLLSSMVILSEDDYMRGCERASELESGFFMDVDNLGPPYKEEI